MDRETAIKKISEKFLIPEEAILDLLKEKNNQIITNKLPLKKEVKKIIEVKKNNQKNQENPENKYFFTKSDFNLLIKQIETISVEIKRIGAEIGDSVSDSKTFHDNFEYEELGRQQKMWTNRLNSLERFRGNVKIITIQSPSVYIGIGSEVKIEMENGETLTRVIGSYITFSDDKMSYNSPLAKIMIGKKAGDKVHDKIDNHFYSFKIIEVN